MLALSRGGRYTLANIVPACRSCNSSKCNDEVVGWLVDNYFGAANGQQVQIGDRQLL